ncbi:MAG: hypothetical protein JWP63_4433 [Candidatus Solibacter sp.]|jgi:hypothetical protein|nr:hypothetical protein [Candidatus Solibacter sp.]
MNTFKTLCCAAIAMCSSMYAQSTPDHITVQLKNPMMVGATRMPAGRYDIQAMRGSSDATILVLRMEGGPSVAAVASRVSATDSDAGGDATLVLNHRGKDLQLSRVMFGDGIGYQLAGVE